jgi:capsular exopolysaccharide synthesis family protein
MTLPSNVGLADQATASLINQYNILALERQKLMRSASEQSPAVIQNTAQLDDLYTAIKRSLDHAKRQLEMERQTILSKYTKYSGQLSQSSSQERVLTEIGRQQTVKSNLYIMLLQKREENSISLAATVDKAKMIDQPEYAGKVSPKNMMIFMIAIVLGLAFPMVVLILIELLRFRIEGHADVEKLTALPIVGDIAVANSRHKTKGDIVVHENKNSQMEEIFRGLRTNINFMLEEGKNVIMFTSATSGEGKTFVTGNLAVSYALLGKKVVMVGLDIRRPRLGKLFEMPKTDKGITRLLAKHEVTAADVKAEILPSGVNDNLDVLLAGPIPPNPSELISRQTLDQIFDILCKEYDYVMVDTAPIGLVTDTLQLARVADVSVIVVRSDYTERSSFAMFNNLASSGKLSNACIAINGIDMSMRKYGYAYGYGKYGRYGKYGSYGKYGRYGSYGSYGGYGYVSYGYGSYSSSHYSDPNDDSVKTKKGE